MRSNQLKSNLVRSSSRAIGDRRRLRQIERLEIRMLLAADFGVEPSDKLLPPGTSFERLPGLSTESHIQWEQKGLGTNLPWTISPDSAPIVTDFQIVEFDALTRTEKVISVEDSFAAREKLTAIERELISQGFDGIEGFVESLKAPPENLKASPEKSSGDEVGSSAYSRNLVFGTDGRTNIDPTTNYPWRAMGRLWIDNNGFGSCSGTMIGPFQFLTAGHCVHGGTNGDGWAENLIVSAGQDGTRLGESDQFRRSNYQFYGEANWTTATTYTGWINNENYDFDLAIVRLDRNLGNHVGWLGYGWNSANSYYTNNTGHTAGYPGDLTPNEFDMWYNFGNAGSYGVTTNQIRTNTMDTWGGQSGSSLYYCIPDCATLRSAHGVVSHHTYTDSNDNDQWDPGEPQFYNSFTRITESKFNDIGGWMTSHAAPTDRADLTDWDQWFGTSLSFMNTTSIRPGQSFSVTTYPRNNGTAATGNFTVSFYASTNTIISTSDRLLGSVSMSSLNPFNWNTATLSLSAFPDIPVGSYYIGWIIDSTGSVSEFLEGNNRGYIAGTTLLVDKALPDSMTTAEGYAMFFNGPTADIANDTLSFNAYIDANSDIDSYYFATDVSGNFTIDVGDFGGVVNPMVAIYDATTGAKIGWDNDNGPDDDALLVVNLSSWTRYIVAVADYSESAVGELSIKITAPARTGHSTVNIDAVTGDGSIDSTIDDAQDTDFFLLTAPANSSGTLNLSVAPVAGLDTVVALWERSTGALLTHSDNAGSGGSDVLSFNGILPGAEYMVSIFSYNYATLGSFLLNVDFATFVDQEAPQVMSVIASSSQWSAAFIDSVDGGGASAGNGLGLLISDAVALLPWNDVDRLYVQFSEDVLGLSAATVQLRDSTGVIAVTVSYDATNFLATLQLSSPLSFSKLRLAFSDAIGDPSGNALDGDFSGVAGGIYDLRFDVLPGDGNGDRRVNGSELTVFSSGFNSTLGQAAYNPLVDWNADGRVNGGDLAIFSSNFNRRISELSDPAPADFSGATSLNTLRDPRTIDHFFALLEEEYNSRKAGWETIEPPLNHGKVQLLDV